MTDPARIVVEDDLLQTGAAAISVGSPAWYEWLFTVKKFSYKGQSGSFVAQCETRRNKAYWYAYRRRSGKLFKAYMGKSEELTPERLLETSLSLMGQAYVKHGSGQINGNETFHAESRMGTSFLPLTKVNVPVLPRQLVSRSRLNQQINTPLTLIYAPSGFGKSTLLNDWKQTCGYPVAWLAVDEHDNHPVRFWYSLVAAFQAIQTDFGKELSAYLGSSTSIQPAEAVMHLTNDLVRSQNRFPRLGLVLDDFHRINHSEIYDSIQLWLEHFPANFQLVISGHTHPPLSLGHLRACGLVAELDANDLRFTTAEGMHYLEQYPQDPPLAYDDLEKLVKHTEGWAAGLTLTALALGKHEDRRQFIDTFSGAHIYLREYFMETVLQRSSPELQSFLLKTAILKNLTGSLCNAITGRTDGEEMLAHLWQENLFIIRLEERGWYRYHDLFAEMLCSLLHTRYTEEVPQLHQRAAQWYREQYAPADAIYHLLSTEAWEEAATLIEDMALRELEQFGEDSRLLRWLQELPENVVQKHKNLLFVYVRLANNALPQKKIERFVANIEKNISIKPVAQQTQDERDVLAEIQHLRDTWAQGKPFTPPSRAGNEYDARWTLLDRLHFLKPTYSHDLHQPEEPIVDLLHTAQAHRNLFVLLMAGGVLGKRVLLGGHLRRSEKLCRQVLEQAFAQRGKLPEPASIALGVLCEIYIERNELELAQKYLAQMVEVDPNPTSTNMFVQSAILRAKLQAAMNQSKEARTTIQAIRSLHLRRPSGSWTDQDLLIYEAFICLRSGDRASAEQIMREVSNQDHPVSRLVEAEILLGKRQFEAAEQRLNELVLDHTGGIMLEPLSAARIPLALALLGQHKTNQALQVMTEMVRMAAPERYIRPFLDHGTDCIPLLSLALETQNLTDDAQDFIRELLQLLEPSGGYSGMSKAEMETLSTSASISAREQEILHLLSSGCSNRDLAEKLSISESTVKTHLGNIYYKLNVNSRVQAITRAKDLKLVR